MPSVYVICPDVNLPSGGIMKLYQLVDILNANEIESFIVHHKKNFKADWFKNSTNSTDLQSIAVKKDDLLVFPEVMGSDIPNYFPGVKKIIFCQNSVYALQNFYGRQQKMEAVYYHQDVVQVLVVSAYDYDFLKWLFPKINITRIWYGIDEKLFNFNPFKKKTIAVMPRKLASDQIFLDNLLKVKDVLQNFSITVIDNMPFEQCAEIIRDATIFLSFSDREGFGLPPAEAMACGCIVIGYHGQGGKEFFKENLTFPIEHGDMLEFAKQISNIIELSNTNPEIISQIGKAASTYILNEYSIVKQEESILTAIRKVLQ